MPYQQISKTSNSVVKLDFLIFVGINLNQPVQRRRMAVITNLRHLIFMLLGLQFDCLEAVLEYNGDEVFLYSRL